MSLAARAIRDTQRFTADVNGFGISIDLIAPTSETITVIGYTTKHHLKYDAEFLKEFLMVIQLGTQTAMFQC